ncbi:MAG: hypothetical protein M1829_001730 [Trizodia sp. TS-e1964]|nr:MAG: hypothetical protein M1829_001730 [Trizodia sp. TS-e1964]
MASKLALASSLALPNSPHRMPQLGFGVYKSPVDKCVASVLQALRTGYRHIDTAQLYANEAEVGKAVRESGFPRAELFVTTKILHSQTSFDQTFAQCAASVEAMGLDYVDLFLIHAPLEGPERLAQTWRALEKLREQGRTRHIGVSNFGIAQIERLREKADLWPPQVNQLELHPWCQQREIVAYCNKHGIAVQAYSPLVRGRKFADATLTSIAEKYSVSPAQILIRYSLQKGWSPLPKSDTLERIDMNADVYGFEIKSGDMEALDELDEGKRGAIVIAVNNAV